jgi:hypothetical protein
MQCADIDDSTMVDVEQELWPDGAAPSTVNRHLYSPVLAILRIALKEKTPRLTRPKGHKDVHPVVIPPLSWYGDLRPHLNPSQLAFVFALAMHGRRTNEMLSRKPVHLDIEAGILDLGRTKTGVRQLELESRALALITAIPGWQEARGCSARDQSAPTASAVTSRRPASGLVCLGITRMRSGAI